jgi:putative heme degradation protein
VYSRIPQDQPGSLGESVFASCPLLSGDIRASARFQDERVLIPLLPRWAVLFRGLKTFGPVISFCRNRCAVLGTVADYPEVVSTPCGVSACGGAGDLKFFFPNWACAFVAVEEHAGDWLYTVEFQDAWGGVVHKIILTPESNFDSFTWWVKINHAPNPASGCLREPDLLARRRAASPVRERFACCQDDFRRFLCRRSSPEVSLSFRWQ